MQRSVDSKQIDCRVFKTGARGECASQNRRTRNDVGKAAADTHDLRCVRNSLEIAAARRLHFGIFWRNDQIVVTRVILRSQDDRPVAADGRIDEALSESLRLRLRANENGDPENDAAQAENKSPLPVEKETQRNIERRCHSRARRCGAGC